MAQAQWTVVSWDPSAARAAIIDREIADAGGVVLRLREPAQAAQLEASDGGLALVALGSPVASGGAALELIRGLKASGRAVFAYEDGARDWPVGIQCQALIGGALRLLDSAAPGFIAELRGLVSHSLHSIAQRWNEEERLRGIMAGLGIVGQSPSMRSLFSWTVRVSALSDIPVSIFGETGTGKELLARAIQRLDPKRCDGPFVAVNCGAISPALAEGELFGHRRGAFTGAERDRKGLIRSAHGGVLLLDEIGELDLGLQTRLLRVLQEQRVLAVGEDRDVPVSVRVIAVTHRDLRAMIRKRQFREDLFHRLNVLSAWIPPLRERPADLRSLVELFLEKHRPAGRTGPRAAGADFLAALEQVKLPGNIRQLENLVRRALVQKENDGPLDLSDLPSELWLELCEELGSAPPDASSGKVVPEGGRLETDRHFLDVLHRNGGNLSQSLEHCERLLVESALRLARGNQSQTGRLLGITPRSVYNKIRKHGLHGVDRNPKAHRS